MKRLTADSAIVENQFAGSLEHISSGTRRRFGSVAELIALIADAIASSEPRQNDQTPQQENR